MKPKSIAIILLGFILLMGCTGKNKQPKVDSLWEPVTLSTDTASAEEFVAPDLSRKEEINKDSLVISVKVSSDAQSTEYFKVIDSAQYVAVYDATLKYNTADPDYVLHDIHVLQISNGMSKTFSRYVYDTDSTDTAMRKSGEGRAALGRNYFFEDIYRNYPEGKFTVSQRSPFTGPVLKYEEEIPEFNWQITEQTKQILSYSCQKATTRFRGRDYEAWFAKDIPLQNGPWKFGGLPGLILEAYDTQKQYTFTCSSFNKLQTPEPIKFWQWDYKNTTRETADKFLRQAYNNPLAFFEIYAKEYLKLEVFANLKNTIYPYNPLELE